MSFIDNLRKRATGILDDDFSGMNYDAMPPQTDQRGVVQNPTYQQKESPLVRNPIFPTPVGQRQKQAASPRAMGAEGLGINDDQAKRIFEHSPFNEDEIIIPAQNEDYFFIGISIPTTANLALDRLEALHDLSREFKVDA